MCAKKLFVDVFNKVRAAVDQREKALLNRVDSYIDQKLQQVARQKQNLAEVQDQLHDSILESSADIGQFVNRYFIAG